MKFLIILRKFYFVNNSFFLILFYLCFLSYLNGQDFSKIEKKDAFKISGSVSGTQTFYHMEGKDSRRDPYFWMVGANLNISVYGINIPLSATISQQNKSFTQPFNQYGLSPRYKDVTVHLGYRSMMFSNFSLGGSMFLGSGVEVNPKNSWVRVAAFYGRLVKPISASGVSGLMVGVPTYGRWGGGAKVSIGTQNNFVDLIVFKAKDKLGSEYIYINPNEPLKAAENFVGSIATTQKIGKKIAFNAEYAFSAFNSDQLAPQLTLEKYTYINNLNFLYNTNSSSQFNKAMLANVTLTQKLFQVKLAYRRIDPEYKSLGCVFLNNDLEDITTTLSTRLFKNKINTSLSAGLQKNNLNRQLATKLSRFAGSFNFSYAVNTNLNVSANASNFNSSTSVQRLSGLDSLSYSQVTNSAGININYSLGSNAKRHNIFLMTNIQQANDNSGKSNSFYNVNFGYQLNFTPQALTFTSSLTTTKNASELQNAGSAGLNLGVIKLMFAKKLRLNFITTYLLGYQNTVINGSTTVLRLNTGYKLNKYHAISSDINVLLKNSSIPSIVSFQEYRATLIYTFTF